MPTYLYSGMPPLRAAPLIMIREPKTASASPPEQGVEQVGHRLGRVLPVPVEQDDDVEAVLDGQEVAGLLVAAVAQVLGLADQGDGEIGGLLVAEAHQVGRVLAVVVGDDDLLDVGRGRRSGSGRASWANVVAAL